MPPRDVERLLAEWLDDEAPAHAPDRILLAANERVRRSGQRGWGRLGWLAGRASQRGGAMRTAAGVVGLLIVVSLALYAGSAPPVNVLPTQTNPLVAASPPPTSVLPTELPPSSDPPPPSPEPSVRPPQGVAVARTVVCGNVTIHDETASFEERGIITGCSATSEVPAGVSIFGGVTHVVNPAGDQHRLHAVWLASPCDTRAELSIRGNVFEFQPDIDQSVRGYDLAVYLPDMYAGCRDEVVAMGVIIELGEAVPAELVTTTSRSSANAADDRITELRVDSSSYDPYATYRLDGIYAIKSVVTETNRWNFCALNFAAIDVARPEDRGTTVLVHSTTARVGPPLEPWNDRTTVLPPGTYRLGTPALPPGVNSSSIAPCEGWVIELHALTQSATDTTDFPGGDNFRLIIDATQTEFAADEPIDVSATLTYLRPLGETITATGSGSGLVGFGIEQLDGELHMSPAQTYDCQGYSLDSGVPLAVPFSKSGGFAADGPNADFYRQYFETPELRLPAGVWRVYARSNFIVGGDCVGERIDLTASITIRVR